MVCHCLVYVSWSFFERNSKKLDSSCWLCFLPSFLFYFNSFAILSWILHNWTYPCRLMHKWMEDRGELPGGNYFLCIEMLKCCDRGEKRSPKKDGLFRVLNPSHHHTYISKALFLRPQLFCVSKRPHNFTFKVTNCISSSLLVNKEFIAVSEQNKKTYKNGNSIQSSSSINLGIVGTQVYQ